VGIQITEKGLSSKARKALSNARNKSRFLREAIEFYVQREESEEPSHDIHDELQEIKTLIGNLQATCERCSRLEGVKQSPVSVPQAKPEQPQQNQQVQPKETETIKIPECYEKF